MNNNLFIKVPPQQKLKTNCFTEYFTNLQKVNVKSEYQKGVDFYL